MKIDKPVYFSIFKKEENRSFSKKRRTRCRTRLTTRFFPTRMYRFPSLRARTSLTQHGWLDFTRCIRAITHESAPRDIHLAGEAPYLSIGIPISAQHYLTSRPPLHAIITRAKRLFSLPPSIDALSTHTHTNTHTHEHTQNTHKIHA